MSTTGLDALKLRCNANNTANQPVCGLLLPNVLQVHEQDALGGWALCGNRPTSRRRAVTMVCSMSCVLILFRLHPARTQVFQEDEQGRVFRDHYKLIQHAGEMPLLTLLHADPFTTVLTCLRTEATRGDSQQLLVDLKREFEQYPALVGWGTVDPVSG